MELNQTSKPPSLQSSCISLNSAKVHPEGMLEMKPVGDATANATISDVTELNSVDERRSESGSMAALRSEGSQTETPTYRIYAMSVCLIHSCTLKPVR